jgi:hypothetical protein
MAGIANSKRSRVTAMDDELPPLNSAKCVISFVPGDEGYNIMVDKIHEQNSVCSDE